MESKETNLQPMGTEIQNSIAPPDNEIGFFSDISAILHEGRNTAYRAVNYVMVETYWKIGRRIVEQEQRGRERANYGDSLLTGLSRYLKESFGNGFSYSNLKYFRQFYLAFPDEAIRHTLCGELSWSHIRRIMRINNEKARAYYFSEAKNQNWSVRVLERNIKTGYFERLLSSQNPPMEITEKSRDSFINEFLKDPYVLEFLGLPEGIEGKESALEKAIIGHLQKFLLEMGRGFSFVGRQFRISTDTSHFFIDLVFYNYLLKCFVVIDLKTKKLTHQDIGQMDMYVRMFDDLKRGEDDNPTLGIILCAEKDETVAKYSVLSESRQIFASKYMTVLPTEEELAAEITRNAHLLRVSHC